MSGKNQGGILIKGGKVVNDDRSFDADVYIQNGLIKKVGSNLSVPAKGVTVIDASGHLVMPGGVDTHTHMQLPNQGGMSCDDFYGGTRAALVGGTTMIIDFVLEKRGVSLLEAYETWRARADDKVCCDYALHVVLPEWNPRVEQEMDILTKEKGINSFKMLTHYKNSYMLEDAELYAVFKHCKQLGALPMMFGLNEALRDLKSAEMIAKGITGPEGYAMSNSEEAEVEAVQRAITIAGQAGSPLYVVHVVSKSTGDCIAAARRKGQRVFGEPLSASLGTDGTHYWNQDWRHAAQHVMGPPLRPDPSTPAYLMDLLANNDLQVTGSDHCPYTTEQRALGKDDFRLIPRGVNGVEDRMAVVWEKGVHSGKMDPCRFVAVTSSTAAKIFNIYPRKGRVAEGSDADVVVWDPCQTRTISAETHHQATDFNIFEGMECHGGPAYVISNGRVVVEKGEIKVTKGSGRFIPTPCFSETVYGDLTTKDQEPKKVERKPYTVSATPDQRPKRKNPESPDLPDPLKSPSANSAAEDPAVPSRRKKSRQNMHESSPALNGSQNGGDLGKKSSLRASNSPGGRWTGRC